MGINFLETLPKDPTEVDLAKVRRLFLDNCIADQRTIEIDRNSDNSGTLEAIDATMHIASHSCDFLNRYDDIWVELFAFIDRGETNWIGWWVTIINLGLQAHPIRYCPGCGLDLHSLLIKGDWFD